MTDQERRARERIRYIARVSAPRSLTKEGSQQFFRLQIQAYSTERLIEAAREGDTDALEILRERSREARRTDANVPVELHAFVWEYFLDGPPKAPPGPSPKSNLLRNILVVLLVKAVHESPSRNSRQALWVAGPEAELKGFRARKWVETP